MKLLPCPFCATYDVEVERTKADGWGKKTFDVFEVCCGDCDIVGPVGDTEAEAMRRWNDRKNASQRKLWNEEKHARMK